MKKIFLTSAIFSFFSLLSPTAANAQNTQVVKKDGCESVGKCSGGKTCQKSTHPNPITGEDEIVISATGPACGSGEARPVLGGVKPPTSIQKLNFIAKTSEGNTVAGIGLILFLSRILQFGSIIAGIWVMFNVISAAFIYITKPGGTDGAEAVKEKLTMSAIGLSLIVTAFLLAGALGQIFFGDAGYILNPQLIGALESTVASP